MDQLKLHLNSKYNATETRKQGRGICGDGTEVKISGIFQPCLVLFASLPAQVSSFTFHCKLFLCLLWTSFCVCLIWKKTWACPALLLLKVCLDDTCTQIIAADAIAWNLKCPSIHNFQIVHYTDCQSDRLYIVNFELMAVWTYNGFSVNFGAIKPAGEMNRECRVDPHLENTRLKNTLWNVLFRKILFAQLMVSQGILEQSSQLDLRIQIFFCKIQIKTCNVSVSFLDAMASPSTYPCKWVSQWVSGW